MSGKVSPGEGDLIWHAKPNRVWKLTLPADCGGDAIVFKESLANRQYRYLVSPTPTAREGAHYIMLERLGLPVADLLAVGDLRTGRRLDRSFIVTRFAEGYQDGRAFVLNGARAGDLALRNAFIRECVGKLALLHRIYFYHKGFKAYNVLWRESASPGLVDLCLIDFASCRFRPKFTFAHHVVEDLADFFASLLLPESELDPHLAVYLACNPGCGMNEAALRKRVASRMAGTVRR
ncbi:MAG: lipopolysaccharide kinase InaA family protein [Planctomycetota bacterium]|nr:lipopolysaccharide kinase InaA family protein [Planctomycetota bacterium]